MHGSTNKGQSVAGRDWLNLYTPNMAAELEPEHGAAIEIFRAAALDSPGHAAIVYFDRTFTYRDLDGDSEAIACFLQEQGVRQGDRVAIAQQNTPEFVLMALAAWKIGAVPLPINPMYRAPELAKIFANAEPSILLCEVADVEQMRGGLIGAGLDEFAMVVTDPRAFGLAFDFPSHSRGEGDPISKLPTLLSIIAKYAGRAVPFIRSDPDAMGLLLYTSGTTGVPKGAMLRNSGMSFNAQLLRDWCELGPQSRIWSVAPFFHITGVVCHILAGFSARATLVLHYRFDPALALDVIRRTRPTFTIGAITVFNAVMNVDGASREDFACFDRIYSGGAPIPVALVETFRTKLGVRIYASYGMTETTSPTHLALFGQPTQVDPGSGVLSIGIPVQSTDAAIVDEAGNSVAPGEVGELIMRGPQIMQGYWRKPEETAAALRDGWMYSGDVGFRDAAGWFYLVDRKKDVIIASGYKVWPREVEDVLYEHAAVREAAVIGVPDDYRGETVKAYVSLVPGGMADPAELIEHCRARLAAYKTPRSIEMLEELPKTITGKIRREALRAPS